MVAKQKLCSKILALALTFALTLTLIPAFPLTVSAAAEQFNISTGAPASGTNWDFGTTTANVLTVNAGADIEITGTATGRRIVVNGTAAITLNNVSITGLDSTGQPALLLNSGADVTLDLKADNTLVGGVGAAGIQTTGAKLTINGNGTLIAYGDGGAGIGGAGGANSAGAAGGEVIINSGTVTATGGGSAAGIGSGGGNQSFPSGAGGTITINGGTVTARGGEYGAGIGGGNGGSGGTITINGGSVTANSDNYGAGIGGGGKYSSSVVGGGGGGTIKITGGTVTANGGTNGAGIGSGRNGAGGNITISGGSVTASGGTNGAGIGGGDYSAGGTITISGSTVEATGGNEAAGIGGGRNGEGGNITISGDSITAIAGSGGSGSFVPAAIGRGVYGASEDVSITGSYAYWTNTTTGPPGAKTGTGVFTYSNTYKYIRLAEPGTPSTSSVSYVNAAGVSQGSVTATQIESDAAAMNSGTTGGWYYVAGTLAVAQRIIVSGDVNLILADGADVTITGGIGVEAGNSLTVWAQAGGTGKLTTSTVATNHAGIGGTGSLSVGGTVTINGGNVTAAGGANSAGIGGGYGGAGGIITINGGTVAATGGSYSAGIGGGGGAAGGTITINGGNVTATAGSPGSTVAIGKGEMGADETVSITGIYDYWTSTTTTPPGAKTGTGTFPYSNTYKYIKLAEPTLPVITIGTHPTATTNVTYGNISGSLSVAASVTESATLSYQWYSNTTASNSGGTAIGGATGASFTIPTALTAGTYYYFCEVRATGEAVSMRSNAAAVTVAKASQAMLVITPPGAKTFGDPPFQLATTGGSGTGAVTYELISGPCSVTSGGLVTITGAGDIVVNATKAADDNYNAVTTFVPLIYPISKANIHINDALNANVTAGEVTTGHTVTLPELPAGVSYAATGTVGGDVPALITGNSVSGHVLTFSASSQSDGTTATITIPVAWGPNYTGAAEVVVTVHAQAILQEDEPDADIHFVTEKLTGLKENEIFTVNGVTKTADADGHIAIEAAWMGSTVTIIKTGIIAAGTIDSDPQDLAIPARSAAPGGVGKTDTTGGGINGTLTGVNATMEYSNGSTWTAITGTTVTGLAAGTYIVRQAATVSAFASAATANLVIAASVAATAPAVTTATLPGGTVGTAYSQTLAATGTAPIIWSVESGSLPGGLTLAANGAVTGTPTAAGTFHFTVKAENVAGDATKALSITVSGGGGYTPTPTPTPTPSPPTPGPSPTPDETLTVDGAADLAEAGKGYTVTTEDGIVITLDPEALVLLAAAHEDGKTPVTVTAEIVPMKDLKGMHAAQVKGYEMVVDITVLVGGQKVDVPITVSLPYTLKANENPAAVCVWHLDDKGSLTKLDGVYDVTTGMITFTIEHQSYFVVGYDPVALWVNIFSDLSSDAWYYDAIAYMNQQGLMVGYGNGNVGGEDTLSRAQFATLIWNLEGKPTPQGTVSFTDVSPDAWYYNPVIWAAENDIVVGSGGGLFNPETPISRQNVARMLYNYAVNFKGYDIPENQDATEYTDNDQLDAWAETAAKALSEAGVLPTDDEFRPQDDATRGEAAEMFRNFLRFIAGG